MIIDNICAFISAMGESSPTKVCVSCCGQTLSSPSTQSRRFPPRNSKEVASQCLSVKPQISLAQRHKRVGLNELDSRVRQVSGAASIRLNLSGLTDERGGDARQLFIATSAGGESAENKQRRNMGKKFQLLLLPGFLCLCQSSIDFFRCLPA